MKKEEFKNLLQTVHMNEQKKIFMEKFNVLPKEIKEQIQKEKTIEDLFEGNPKSTANFLQGVWDWGSSFFRRKADEVPPAAANPPPGFDPSKNSKDFDFEKRSDGGFGIDPIPNAQKPGPRVDKDPNAVVPVDTKPQSVVRVPEDPKKGNLIKDLVAGTAIAGGLGVAANQLLDRDRQDAGAQTPAVEPPKFQGGADKMEKTPEQEINAAAASAKSFDAAFKAARAKAEELAKAGKIKNAAAGQFSWGPEGEEKKQFQTNIAGERYIAPKKQTKVEESLLAAFNDVINSKSPNLFAEAAKKNASEPKTEKEKSLAALAEPKDKITHKDVLVGRGVVKEEEQIDEAAFKLTDAHKKVITTHLNKNIGKGKVTFDSEDGGHFATHSDGIQSTVHHVQMKNGKLSLSHFMTMDEEVGFSEAELSHFASIVEGMPVAPTPEDQAPTPTPKNKAEGGKGKGGLAEGRKKEEESLGDNMLHMNVKKAADNMANVKHKFANGETVNMTKGMAVGFLNRHSSAKTADQKDAILKHANKSFDAFKHITQGGDVPKEESPKIKLGTMKGR
jgi:hypothetical protein